MFWEISTDFGTFLRTKEYGAMKLILYLVAGSILGWVAILAVYVEASGNGSPTFSLQALAELAENGQFDGTFQTLVFMSLGLVTFVYISGRLGGLSTAMQQVQQTHPQLLTTAGGGSGLELFSYLFIPLSAAMFPHLFMHWLSARDAAAFRLPVAAYPVCIAILWGPEM